MYYHSHVAWGNTSALLVTLYLLAEVPAAAIAARL